ncbi:hypothetical protein BDC45DRAFT_253095 [Circinella umbellata]|nr:hypothetical protein BDC45DRAFT_253095 [Circinella umbellata]
MKLSCLASAFICFVAVASGAVDLEDGFEKVTCGSTIKLTHQPSGFKLHSHGVSYGNSLRAISFLVYTILK